MSNLVDVFKSSFPFVDELGHILHGVQGGFDIFKVPGAEQTEAVQQAGEQEELESPQRLFRGSLLLATALSIMYNSPPLLNNLQVEQLNILLMYSLPYSCRAQGGGLALP